MPNDLKKKLVLCVATKADGPHGQPFAIGAVVCNITTGQAIDTFSAKAELQSISDTFTINEVLPVVKRSTGKIYESRREMRNAFWEFYMWYREMAIVLGDFNVPYISNLFRDCIFDEFRSREHLAPQPLHELSTFLYAKHIDPNKDRKELIGSLADAWRRHDPLQDAMISAYIFCAYR